jgi:hypothetical protein
MATSKLVHNERVKLGATFFNNIAAGCFIAAFLVPMVGRAQGHQFAFVALWGVSGVLICFALHLYARWGLRRLLD